MVSQFLLFVAALVGTIYLTFFVDTTSVIEFFAQLCAAVCCGASGGYSLANLFERGKT